MTLKGKSPRVSQAEYIKNLETQLDSLKNKGEGEEINTNVPMDDLITVMSLLPYPLNLSTREKGQGKTVRFDSFGQVKRILYRDLLDMLEVSAHFIKNGYYIILDPRVVKAHGLQETYSKLLTKENIDKVLSGSKGAVELFKSANFEQQRVIITMMIEKLRDDPEAFDLNLVDQISRVSGIKIQEAAEDARVYFNVGAEVK